MSETTTPEPEWPTRLYREMRTALDGYSHMADRAAAIAVACVEPLHARIGDLERGAENTVKILLARDARIAELERERDEAAANATRLAKLLAAPLPVADEYASLKDQLKFDVHTAFANQLLTDAQLFEDAKHWQTGAASRLLDAIEPEIDRYIAAMLRDRATPAPALREVPASEAREGDTVMLPFEVVHVDDGWFNAKPLGAGDRALAYTVELSRHPEMTVSRPVSPLPDQPGAVGTATVRGVKGCRVVRMYAARERPEGRKAWLSVSPTHLPSWCDDADIIDFTPAPAGADVPEGGKA